MSSIVIITVYKNMLTVLQLQFSGMRERQESIIRFDKYHRTTKGRCFENVCWDVYLGYKWSEEMSADGTCIPVNI